jgi:hypothetical protein
MIAYLKTLTLNRSLFLTLTVATTLLMVPTWAVAGFDWDIENTGAVNEFFELGSFHTFVTNTSAVPDTVMVNMVKNIPADWVASLCEETLCYPPFLLDIELILSPGETTELIIDITAVTNLGKGSTDITLTSKNNPADALAATFSVITAGLDVLFVSGVSAGANEALFTDAISAAGKTHATWDLASMGKATTADLTPFDTVIWGTGPSFVSRLNTTDMTNLTAYVADGGNIFITGQNLAFAYCDLGSPFYDATARAWFQNTLGTSYTANVGSTDFVTAAAGDIIFGGASYNINGGDGSNNNNSPDAIAPVGGGSAGLDFSGGGQALVSTDPATGKTAFASFGFEGIATAASREAFLTKLFAWFAGEASAVGDDVLPVLARRPQAWPNPFNPQTNIRFEVGGARAVPAEVIVYDLQGRAVRHLFQGTVSPGPRSLTWNGRDDHDRHLATGVYLARVKVATEHQVVKMTLAK